jgi:hypothetical protein
MNIGRVGIWSMALEAQPLSAAQEAVAELDELGFPALWIPEALGKEVMSHAALLLAATPHDRRHRDSEPVGQGRDRDGQRAAHAD